MNLEKTLTVTDLARGGSGVARTEEGQVVFIPFTAPGDQVRVRVVAQEKRYFQAELIEVITPSIHRVQPKCAVFGQCGGCQWQHLPYALQWQTKVKGVFHALKRVNLLVSGQADEIPAEQIWEYRNRVQLRGAGRELGFLRPESSTWVPIQRCEIARPEINDSLDETRTLAAQFERPFKVEIEVSPTYQIKRAWNSPHAATGFRQVHDAQNEKLKAWVQAQFQGGGDTLYDLYGGSGNLSLGLRHLFRDIHCVDTGAPLSQGSSDPHYHFHRSSVMTWIVRASECMAPSPLSAVILDPPRAGLDLDFKDIAGAVEKLGVKKLIAIGCDVDSWVKDLSKWSRRGWKIEKVMMIDLFPQTVHVECAAVLSL